MGLYSSLIFEIRSVYEAQAGLELKICLFQLPECWDAWPERSIHSLLSLLGVLRITGKPGPFLFRQFPF